MSESSRRLVGGGAVLVLLAAAAWYLMSRGQTVDPDAARAASLIASARKTLATARSENLYPLAEAEFDAAAGLVTTADEQLRDGDSRAAVATGERAVTAAESARELATSRAPVARVATLLSVRNKVVHRARDAVGWQDATAGMKLYDRDRIATRARAEAGIEFYGGNIIRLEENSVLVVETLQERRDRPVIAMAVEVAEGGARTEVTRSDEHDVSLRINLKRSGMVVDTSLLHGGKADIAARVHPDQTERFAVYDGVAEVVGPSGDRVKLTSNQFAEVAADGQLSEVRQLPPRAGIILLPGRDATVYISSHRPEVTFRWKQLQDCAEYRLEVATDAQFFAKVIDQRIGRDRFTYDDIQPGVYLWRMSCLDDKGTQGKYSDVTRFTVIRDDQAPPLKILAPADNAVVATETVEARCRTEPGAAVFINGEEAAVGTGTEFTRTVALAIGVNTLVFEAIDDAGNVMYNSRLVTRSR